MYKGYFRKHATLFLPVIFLSAGFFAARAQKVPDVRSVAITIDDIPNTVRYLKDGKRSLLLEALDSLRIPVCIFATGGKLRETDSLALNRALLYEWLKREYITPGNHTYSHFHCSEIGPDAFIKDVDRGDSVIRPLAEACGKPLRYFRFPYNDLGKDSSEHARMENLLASRNYTIMPFTVESADWMYNELYEHYLDQNDPENAAAVGREYVHMTMRLFTRFDSLAQKQYGRHIPQIYLCHDNPLNAAWLPHIVRELRRSRYRITDIATVLNDDFYRQPDRYDKKWGISWFYRYMADPTERMRLLRAEPEPKDLEKRLEEVKKR